MRVCATILSRLDAGLLPPATLKLQLQYAPAPLIACAAAAFEQLTTLHLQSPSPSGVTAQLPSIPTLRHLVIGAVADPSQAAMWASAAPCAKQLTSLCIKPQPDAALTEAGLPLWSTIFDHPTHTLTHLDVPVKLQPWLVRLLHQAAPRVQELTCGAPDYEHWHDTNIAVPEVCSWSVLKLRGGVDDATIEHVPLPATGTLVLDAMGDDVLLRPPLEAPVSQRGAQGLYDSV